MMDDRVVNTMVRSVLSLAVLLAGIASKAALALTFQSLPEPVSHVAGVFATTFFFPAAFAAIVGGFGTPYSWLHILEIFLKDPLDFILSIPGTIYEYIVFLPFDCPDFLSWLPDWIKWLIFRDPPQVYCPSPEQQNSSKVKNELWIYINGIATTQKIAKSNRELLSKMFSRPVYLCHNPTDSIIIDVIETIFGKIGPFTSFWELKPRRLLVKKLRSFLYEAKSKGFTRVVLISHSQGTVITSNALEELASDPDPEVNELMKKYLEVYAFADCAHQMPGQNVKYLENISNGADTVAWLGVLFPFPDFWEDVEGRPIRIDGARVTEPLFWGHLLETHYFTPMKRGAYQNSRLRYYLGGGGKLMP